jgi:hypothetical protein
VLIYRIDYEIDRVSHREQRVSFRATKPECGQLKKELGTTVTAFAAKRVDVPTDRYGLTGWLNKNFGATK